MYHVITAGKMNQVIDEVQLQRKAFSRQPGDYVLSRDSVLSLFHSSSSVGRFSTANGLGDVPEYGPGANRYSNVGV